MAIIEEHHDDQPTSPSKLKPKPKPISNPDPKPRPSKPNSNPTQTHPPNPFKFWFYFTLTVSLITLLFISLSSLTTPDPKTWFLNLPPSLRTHYSSGRIIKVQINPNQPQVGVFTYSRGPRKHSENVVILHGLGCSSYTFRNIVDGLGVMGVFGVSIDLPGSGFSDKAVEVEEEREESGGGGVLARVLEVYEEIKEKGIFWGFDHMVEHGYLPYAEGKEAKIRVRKEKVVRVLELGGNEVGRVLGQVLEGLGVGDFHLVLHDSALGMVANWVIDNAGAVRSVTLMDSLARGVGVALPLGVFEVPMVREVAVRMGSVFGRVIGSCCLRSGGAGFDVEGHRLLLLGKGGREAVVGMGRKLNQSFDLGEWVGMDGVKGMPMQVLWSGGWSEEWSEEGRRVAEVVPHARFLKHSGGRWPQDDTSSEVAESIVSFVSSLPKIERKADEEPLPEHVQKMFDEAKADGHHHHGHDHHEGYSHDHGAHAGYMDAYGLGHGQGLGM